MFEELDDIAREVIWKLPSEEQSDFFRRISNINYEHGEEFKYSMLLLGKKVRQ